MGLDMHGLRFVLEARKQGMSLGKTATLGRQTLAMSARDASRLLSEFDKPISMNLAHTFFENGSFVDTVIRYLGAKSVTSFDASDYEGAAVIHDMNLPIPEELHERFDLVIDGGTLEHIFNFPTAIKNALSMVREGGRFIMLTPTNNAMGHGFYQFSPELLYRVCHPDNGYRVERMQILDSRLFRPRVYEVADPADIRDRVMVTEARRPAILLVQAVRTELKPIFANTPQQSDYSLRWEDHAADSAAAKVYSGSSIGQSLALFLRRHIHHPLVQQLLWLRYKGFYPGSYSPRYFKRIR